MPAEPGDDGAFESFIDPGPTVVVPATTTTTTTTTTTSTTTTVAPPPTGPPPTDVDPATTDAAVVAAPSTDAAQSPTADGDSDGGGGLAWPWWLGIGLVLVLSGGWLIRRYWVSQRGTQDGGGAEVDDVPPAPPPPAPADTDWSTERPGGGNVEPQDFSDGFESGNRTLDGDQALRTDDD